MDQSRQAFEAHMREQNPCVRLSRQREVLGGHYRTTTVRRAWELWQASRKQALEEAAAICEAFAGDGRDQELRLADLCADAIRSLTTPPEGDR